MFPMNCKRRDKSMCRIQRNSHLHRKFTQSVMKPIIILLLILCVSSTFAQTEQLRKKNFNVKNNLAIDGYDPVSYFDGVPKEGDEDITYSYKGITYHFGSSSTQNRFKANPEKFEPAYGGWCAYAMGESGEKVKVDPETFKIIDGRLYLFYNFWGNNTLGDWNENEAKLKVSADQHWKKSMQ
jgi:YHS domain-containing protein